MKLSKNFTNPLAANNPVIVQILGDRKSVV